MKTLNRVFLIAIAVWSLALVSCSNDDSGQTTPVNETAKTYVSLSISLPKSSSAATRALPGDYNENGSWAGRDVIKSITIYMIGENSVTKTEYTDQLSIDESGQIWPVIVAQSQPGNVKAFVVINNNSTLTDILDSKLNATAQEFTGLLSEPVEALATNLANSENSKDVILMTNLKLPEDVNIEANVNEAAARRGENKISMSVERMTSRGIVTIKESAKTQEIKVKDARGNEISKIQIKEVKYGVGQSNNAVYPIKKADFSTPSPTDRLDLDYSGLTELFELKSIASTANADVLTALEAEESAKYVLPLVRQDYLKGNTTFFEVRATFDVVGDLADTTDPYVSGQTVYLGMQDGKFYADRNTALGMGEALTEEQIENGDFDFS